jgi:uncharacterized protein
MRRAEVLERIARHAEELRADHGVASLSVFGSVARDEARPDSDVDVLVEFSRPVGLFAFGRLQDRLSEILESRVDLATPASLHSSLRVRILAESIRAA